MKRAVAVLALLCTAMSATLGISTAAETYQEITVNASAGGGLVADSGLFEWQIPANAYGENLKIRYTPRKMADYPAQPTGSIWATDPFELSITAAGDPVGTNVPTTVIVRYNPADLGGRSEATLRLVKNVAERTIWGDVPSTVDTTRHTVTAQVTESGDYGLAVSNVAPPAPAPAPTAVPTPVPAPPPPPTAVPVPLPAPVPAAPPAFSLGFATLATIIPDVVGQPVENEHYGANGDSLQQTTTGLMVWRKADNWTAFTNGSRTWVNGPYGVMERANDARFDWEK